MNKLTIKNLLTIMNEHLVIKVIKEGKLIYNGTEYPTSLEDFVVE